MQKEKWAEIRKGADYAAIGRKFGIDPVTARIIRNRGMVSEREIGQYLKPDRSMLHSPHQMKDIDLLTGILKEKIQSKKMIRIIGDYDIDGIQSAYILQKGIERAGGMVSAVIPDRMKDGYGINRNLIDQAAKDGADTILTCDNGIAAIDEIAYAKEIGLTVLVTDHHDIPAGKKSSADAIVNPKQAECGYPFSGICGAAVAWKAVQALYEAFGIAEDEADMFLENVAFATVCDVMDLVDENRIFVTLGLRQMRETKNKGLLALMRQKEIRPDRLGVYHLGFVLGPCLNAGGRLDTAKRPLALLCAEDEAEAARLALELSDLNEERKRLTEEGIRAAKDRIEKTGIWKQSVIVIYLSDLHESIAGIVAGRLREQYGRPVFVLTDAKEGIKGSGRSIEAYSMYEELCKCKEFFLKYGGHPMAAGFTLLEKDVDAFAARLNENASLREEDFAQKVLIDAILPLSYVTENLIEEWKCLEPFGKGNSKPLFAARTIRVTGKWLAGKNRNVLRLTLSDESGTSYPAVYFGDAQAFFDFLETKQEISITYYPEINEYMGRREIQFVISNYL